MRTIFICIDWFSPAYKGGGPIVSINNLVSTFKEGICYKIVCSNCDLDGERLHGVNFDMWTKYNEYTQVWYASKNSNVISLLKSELRKTPEGLMYINGIYSFYYNFLPILFCSGKKIICPRGMLHPEALAKKRIKKTLYLKVLKLLIARRTTSFHASTDEEAKYIVNIFGKNVDVVTAENFPKEISQQPALQKDAHFLKLVSISLIGPMKNHLNVLCALQKCGGEIKYDIYGPIKDEAYWKLCLKKIEELPSNIAVKYHSGIVAQEVEKALMKSHVFIQPSESENFGHSIIEALSAGKPVITSTRTPWNKLKETYAGINILPNDIAGLTNAINFFSKMRNAEYQNWATSSSKYAKNAININMLKTKYEKLFSLRKTNL